MTVVSFPGYTPTPRYDDLPWTQALIQETADAVAGEWDTIETVTLDPVDEDPTTPSDRSLTTSAATLDTGFYRIVWKDAAGNLEPTEAFEYPRREDLVPTIEAVAALLHARTLAGGTEVGTFNENTTPTGSQVSTIIAAAVNDLRGRIGTTIPDFLADDARYLASLQAAALIEASFFPGEIDTDHSAYRQYTAMYLAGVTALLARLASSGISSVPGGSWVGSLAVTTDVAVASAELGLDDGPWYEV